MPATSICVIRNRNLQSAISLEHRQASRLAFVMRAYQFSSPRFLGSSHRIARSNRPAQAASLCPAPRSSTYRSCSRGCRALRRSIRTISRVWRTCARPSPVPVSRYSRPLPRGQLLHVGEDRAAREPQRRAHHAGKAEDVGPAQEAVEADQAAHRRPGQPGVLGLAPGCGTARRSAASACRSGSAGRRRRARRPAGRRDRGCIPTCAAAPMLGTPTMIASTPSWAIRSIVSSTPHSPANDIAWSNKFWPSCM